MIDVERDAALLLMTRAVYVSDAVDRKVWRTNGFGPPVADECEQHCSGQQKPTNHPRTPALARVYKAIDISPRLCCVRPMMLASLGEISCRPGNVRLPLGMGGRGVMASSSPNDRASGSQGKERGEKPAPRCSSPSAFSSKTVFVHRRSLGDQVVSGGVRCRRRRAGDQAAVVRLLRALRATATERIQLVLATPLPGIGTKHQAASHLFLIDAVALIDQTDGL